MNAIATIIEECQESDDLIPVEAPSKVKTMRGRGERGNKEIN